MNPRTRDLYLMIGTLRGETGTIRVNGVELVSERPGFVFPRSHSYFTRRGRHEASYHHIGRGRADGTTVAYGSPIGTRRVLGHEDDLSIGIAGFSNVRFGALAREFCQHGTSGVGCHRCSGRIYAACRKGGVRTRTRDVGLAWDRAIGVDTCVSQTA